MTESLCDPVSRNLYISIATPWIRRIDIQAGPQNNDLILLFVKSSDPYVFEESQGSPDFPLKVAALE